MKRLAALGLGLLLSWIPFAGGSPAPDPAVSSAPSLLVEYQLATQISAAGTVDLVPTAVSEDRSPLARSLALAHWARLRGRTDEARHAVLTALSAAADSGDTPGRADLRGRLYRLLLELEPGEEGEALLVRDDSREARAARMFWAARRGRCGSARTEGPGLFGSSTEGEAEALTLAAEAWSVCGAPQTGLALLAGAGAAPSRDPRISLAAGELSLKLGDGEQAALLCREAVQSGRGVPALFHRAEICVAAGLAHEGVLPRAERDFAEAQNRAAADPALPKEARVRAALASIWSFLSLGAPTDLGRADEALRNVRVLAGSESLEFLNVVGAALEIERRRPEEARKLLERGRANPPAPEAVFLRALVEARLAVLEKAPDAAQAWAEKARLQSHSGLPAVFSALAEAELGAVLAMRGEKVQAETAFLRALALWPPEAPLMAGNPFGDPAFGRRTAERTLALEWVTGIPEEREVESLIRLMEKIRLKLDGQPEGTVPQTTLNGVQGALAVREAGLVAFLVGGSRTFALKIEPGLVRAITLPPGDQLVAGNPEDGDLSSLVVGPGAGALGSVFANWSPGRFVFLLGDGFLHGLPWNALPVSSGLSSSPPRSLGSLAPVACQPNLAAVTSGAGGRVAPIYPEPRFLAVGVQDGTPLPRPPLVSPMDRWADYRLLPLEKTAPGELSRETGAGLAVLFLDLPLLVGGAGPESVFLALPSPEDPRRLTPLRLQGLWPRANPPDLVVLSGGSVWGATPSGITRFGEGAIAEGARASLLALHPRDEAFWNDFLARLMEGKTKNRALAETLDLHAFPAASVLWSGYGENRVFERPPADWPFWCVGSVALLMILIGIFRIRRSRVNPFDEEPPEEEPAG